MSVPARPLLRSIAFAATLGLSLSLSAGAAFAQNAAAVEPSVAKMLKKAAERDEGANLQAVTLIAIEANPEKALDILAAVAAIAPDKAPAIRSAAMGAFPSLNLAKPVSEPELKKKPGLLSLDGWKGALEVAATRSTGNTQQTAASVIGKAVHESENWTHKLNGLFDFERTDGFTSKRRWLAGYDINYTLSDRTYLFGSVQYENDRFSQIDYRFTEAAGMGYRVIRRDNMTFNLEAGPGSRQTSFIDNRDETEFAGYARSAFLWKFTDTASLSHDLVYIYGNDQQTLDTTAALKLRIIGALSGQFSYNYRYNSAPPLGTHKVDTVSRAGLVYDF
ncbi:DUF481 domain-containing protein [Govanella unica]|uniref:DUF481 domain-containing protein n=1 Tax=Govanella unica TaxID=2975056 RepID=A0A9X3TUJ3_9PROT|nr:DUF481 domain-containing protein [Govania unica]MDA5192470.1 DUF481 domain-containing protein [Govania unica]